jgi:hypothetical protein
MFDTIGREYGFNNHIHYYHGSKTHLGNKKLSTEEILEGNKSLCETHVFPKVPKSGGNDIIEPLTDILDALINEAFPKSQLLLLTTVCFPKYRFAIYNLYRENAYIMFSRHLYFFS